MANFSIFNHSSEDMREVASESIDLVVTDVPFNIGLNFGGKKDYIPHEDYVELMGRVISEMSRVLTPRGLLVLPVPEKVRKEGETYEYPPVFSGLCQKTGLSMIYDFNYEIQEEADDCVPLSDWGDVSVDKCHSAEIKGLTFSKLHRRIPGFISNSPYHYKPREGHPCPYPAKLIEDLLDAFYVPQAAVLDPFMGIGDLGVAVLRRGGSFTGFELSPNYFKLAQEKLQQANQAR